MQVKMLDNKKYGTVANEIKKNVDEDTKLSVISALFTIYAYKELKKELKKIDEMRFLFTQPFFIKNNPEVKREYYIDNIVENKLSGEVEGTPSIEQTLRRV